MRNKYNNSKTSAGDSKMEVEFENLLNELGINFRKQVRFCLLEEFLNRSGEKINPINYIADFVLDGLKIVVDVKGVETPDFKLKKKMFQFKYPEYDFLCLTKAPASIKYDGEILFKGFITVEGLKKHRANELNGLKVSKETTNAAIYHNIELLVCEKKKILAKKVFKANKTRLKKDHILYEKIEELLKPKRK